MIKKLKTKIFLIISLPLIIIVFGIIVLIITLNHKSTLNVATNLMNMTVNHGFRNGEQIDSQNINKNIQVDGIYYYIVDESKDLYNSDREIEKTINKIKKQKNKNGIVGKYVYNKIKLEIGNMVAITLLESQDIVNSIKKMYITAVIIFGMSVFVIYIVSKKITEIIVTPVENTIEKQKQFISDASHELKTPLAVIEANSDVLENEIGSNKWLGYIQKEIECMNKLINDLLLLTKTEYTSNKIENKKINASEKINIVVAMFESVAYERKVKLNSKIEENVYINGNEDDIEHICSILIDNAIKHTKSDNNVIVELYNEKNNMVLKVKNQGEPIPKNEREKIFERFYRIDKARNRNEKRYGLGLAILKSIIQKNNGQVKVNYEDGYTIFEVKMPKGTGNFGTMK